MMKWWLLLLTVMASHALAEDIELYIKRNADVTKKPRVMVVFDTSGSMAFSSTTGEDCGYDYFYDTYILCADNRLGVAKTAITTLVNDNPDIDFGLMRFNDSNGGYILAGLGSNTNKIKNQINALEANGATPLSETLWEAYLYLTGGSRYYSWYWPSSQRDTSVERYSKYISPFESIAADPNICSSSANLIVMTDGDPSNDSQSNWNIATEYWNTFSKSATTVHDSYMPALAEIIRHKEDLYTQAGSVEDRGRVYTIGFGRGMSDEGTEILQKTADLGGGIYTQANTPHELSEALKNQIDNIRQLNDSFSSPSVSTSSSDHTRSGESLYYTMFYPESHTRWQGNLKKLKFSDDKVVDMHGAPALDEKGLIKASATTFWSQSGSQDGNSVKRGGVNYQLSQQITRTIYSDFGTDALLPLTIRQGRTRYKNRNKFARKFGTNASQLQNTIDWLYGKDVDDEDQDNNTQERRDTIFGDPLHSKPVSMDYGNGDIRIVVGTNDGFLHMFKDSGNTVQESWAFMPEYLFKNVSDIRNSKPDTKLYGMDGPLTIYFHDTQKNGVVDGNDKVWLFAGMRRGGARYYAFDITSPDSPKLMWGGPLVGGQGGFEELGQSWSKPEVTFVEAKGDSPVLIFGAGYDTGKDNYTKATDQIGRGIFVLDAATGALVWSLTPKTGYKGAHSVAGDVAMLDSNYDGYTDRLYFADTGGDVWRVDMPSAAPNDSKKPWTHHKLAQLAQNGSSGDRRFFYKPAVVRTFFSKVTVTTTPDGSVKTRKDTPYEAVMLGSGNRSRPTLTGVNDYLFMIRDEHTVTQSFQTNVPEVITIGNLMDITGDPFALQRSSLEGFTNVEATLGAFKGWKYALSGNEKSLAAPVVAGGIAYFTSFTPPANVSRCEVSTGKGHMYAFHLHYGTQVYEQLKYETTHTVPDTPKVYFSCEGGSESESCKTVVRMVGPALDTTVNSQDGGPSAGTPWTPSALVDDPVPVLVDGKVSLVKPSLDFGLTTRQMFIYKKEQNDEK
ncbi:MULTISPECIES: pilus assembly protein [Pseudoalteromonas]|nr:MULTISPECIES: PilC/PilY family type IV pilus protein [Pseudoalteromonas]